jgi:hypothetical protein
MSSDRRPTTYAFASATLENSIMKITYNKNPLRTTVELDEHEKEILWYKVKVKEMEEDMLSAQFHLTQEKYYDMNKVKEHLDPEYFMSNGPGEEKSGLDQRVDMLTTFYISQLMGWHCGDCTCVPCSCLKCAAEELIGIDTIKGLSKHQATKIDSASVKAPSPLSSISRLGQKSTLTLRCSVVVNLTATKSSVSGC